jgi:hypothetical protein
VIAKDGAIVAELARKTIDKEKPTTINVDVNGIGSSVFDHLKVMYNGVIPFNGAEASTYRDRSGKLKMRNKRAEMYWRMRDALDPVNGDDIALPPDTELLADLCSARYEVSAAGVLVEAKEKIKERIGLSSEHRSNMANSYKAIVSVPGWAEMLEEGGKNNITTTALAYAYVPLIYRAVRIRCDALIRPRVVLTNQAKKPIGLFRQTLKIYCGSQKPLYF